MASDLLSDSVLSRLRLAAVRAYVEQHGWRRAGDLRGNLAIFQNAQDALRQLLVPITPDFVDYADIMRSAIGRIADFERRPATAVAQDLLSITFDTLRFSVQAPETARGTLPIEHGLQLLQGAQRSLLAAACSVLEPGRTFHKRMTMGDAEEFVNSCELGQTEIGSYTVTVLCPMLTTEAPATGAPNAPPFGRRATSTLFNSLTTLVTVINADRVDDVMQPFETGGRITSNLCDALVRMQPERDTASIAISVSWSPAFPAAQAPSITLRNEHFPVINDIGKRLRGETEPEFVRYVAYVEELRGTINERGQRQGEVRFALVVEDEVLKTGARLDADQYRFATAAHTSGEPVAVTGIFTRGPRVSRLDNVGLFPLQQAPAIPPPVGDSPG